MDLSSLSVEEAASFVARDLDMPALADLFREQDVDGSVLIELTTPTIREFLPTVTLGQCVKLFSRLEKYKRQISKELIEDTDTDPISRLPSNDGALSPSSATPASPVMPERPVTPVIHVTQRRPMTLASPVRPARPVTPASPVTPARPVTPASPVTPLRSASPVPSVSPATPARPTPSAGSPHSVPVPREFPIDKLHVTPAGTAMIETGEQTIAGKTAITNAVVILIQKYSNSDGYASFALKRMAATSLVCTHPSLTMGMSVKDAVEAWHRAFSQKLVNWRKRGKVVDPNMEDMKEKYRRREYRPRTEVGRSRQTSAANQLNEEEVRVMTEMKEVLQLEMSKPTRSRNHKVLLDLTEESYRLRRQFVLNDNPHAQVLLKEWPSLKVEQIIMKEFQRIADVAGFPEFLSRLEGIVPKLVDMARGKAAKYPSNHPLSAVLTQVPVMESTDPDYNADAELIAALVALPYLLPTTAKKAAHPHRYLADICSASTPADAVKEAVADRNQPFMLVFGDMRYTSRIIVYADKVAAVSCMTVPRALYIVLTMYFILNIEYAYNVAPSLEFLQTACLGLRTNKVQTRVRELLQKLA